jgi:hypothetical protein
MSNDGIKQQTFANFIVYKLMVCSFSCPECIKKEGILMIAYLQDGMILYFQIFFPLSLSVVI